MVEEEVWVGLTGCEKSYKVSNMGQVYSCKTDKLIGNCHGVVNIKGKSCNIGYLVAKMFIPNPNNYTKIIHKDENSSNNRVSNLEWVDDTTYNYKTKKRIIYSNNTTVICIETGEEKSSWQLARELNVPHKLIMYACISGKKLGGKHYREKFKRR